MNCPVCNKEMIYVGKRKSTNNNSKIEYGMFKCANGHDEKFVYEKLGK